MALSLIEDEAFQFGYLNRERVLELLDLDTDKRSIPNLHDEWASCCKLLVESDESTTVDAIKRTLQAMAEVNRSIIFMSSQRYAYLIRENYGHATEAD